MILTFVLIYLSNMVSNHTYIPVVQVMFVQLSVANPSSHLHVLQVSKGDGIFVPLHWAIYYNKRQQQFVQVLFVPKAFLVDLFYFNI